jgi:hypothetical protein
MNPYAHLGIPFPNSKFSENSSPLANSNANPLARPEFSNNASLLNLFALQSSRILDQNGASRYHPSYEAYSQPTKRIRHQQEDYTEIGREMSKLQNQPRQGVRLEESLQSRIGFKPPDEAYTGLNHGLRRIQGSFPLGQSENSAFNSNPNVKEAMLLKLLGKSKSDLNNQLAYPFQNEPFSGLTNNLLSNSYQNSALNFNNALAYAELFKQIEAQQALQQYHQLLYSLQDPSKLNLNLRNNQIDLNNGLQIPPLNQMNGFKGSPMVPILNPIVRSEVPEKIQTNSYLKEGFKRPNSNQLAEAVQQHLKLLQESPKKDVKGTPSEIITPSETTKSQEHLEREELNKDSLMKDEEFKDLSQTSKDPHNLRKRAKLLQQKTSVVSLAYQKKLKGNRRKNKWQVQLEKKDKPTLRDSPMGNIFETGKISPDETLGKRSWDVFQGAKENQEENIEMKHVLKLASSSRGNKRKTHYGEHHRGHGNLRGHKDKHAMMYEDDSLKNALSVSTNFNTSCDDNRISITSSFGRNFMEITAEDIEKENEATRVGKGYQAHISDLDLNAQNSVPKRILNVAWSPEIMDSEALSSYTSKLQTILGCKGINEEKAIQMLKKKNMIQEEVVATIKKNQKFYSNFLGIPQSDKEIRNRKGSEDVVR